MLLFFQTSLQALFWRLLRFSLVVLYVFGQGIVTIFSWRVKAVNRYMASVKLWVEDVQHSIYSHTKVGRSLNCIYQVTITTLWVTGKHLVVTVSRKVLKKPPSRKTPKIVTHLVSPFFTQMQKKGLGCTEKVFQLAKRSEICKQTSLQTGHFFWSQVE